MEFHPIALRDMEPVERLRRVSRTPCASHAFPSLWIWRDTQKLDISISDDVFVVRRSDLGEDHFYFPCGSPCGILRAVDALLPSKPVFHYVRAEDMEWVSSARPGRIAFEEARNDWEYLYDRAVFCALSGGKYHHLRAKIRRAERTPGLSEEPLTEWNRADAIAVLRTWARQRGLSMGEADDTVMMHALNDMKALSLTGLLIRVDGEPIGFALGCEVADGVYDLLGSKTTLPNFDHYIKWALCKALPESIHTINREDDLGDPNLRQHKMEMLPCGFNPIWRGVTVS